jgi:hypothetical protein
VPAREHRDPFPPGPAGERPALVALDDTHLAVVFLQGVDVGGTGVASGAKPSVAVLDLATPGVVSASDVPGTLSDVTGAAHPSAAKVGGSVYLAWEADALSTATPGTHIWLKPIPWTSTLDLTHAETPMPRRAELRVGDQERGNVCATPLAPTGGLLETWVDLGQTFAHSKGEIGVQLVPRPD